MYKKKILFVIHSSAATGGAEDDIENILKCLHSKNKYIIHGLFPDGPRKELYVQYLDKFGLIRWGVFPIIYEGIFNYFKYLVKSWIQFYQVWKFVRKEEYDLCLISVAVLLWPSILLKMFNYKTIIFIKETIEPEPVRKIIYKILSLCGYFFIPNSNIIKNEFIKFTDNLNIETVYSSVNNSECKVLTDNEYESLLGPKPFMDLHTEKLKLLVIGNFTKIKNNILAAQCLKKIKDELDIDQKLFIVGSNEIDQTYYKKFDNYIHKNKIINDIYLLGPQSKDVLFYLFKKVDMLIIPSLSEGIPLILVYALKYKLPIITSNVGGIRDVIISGSNGILIKPDINTLFSAIKLMYKNKELITKLATNGYETYLKKFNYENNLAKIENLIDKCLII